VEYIGSCIAITDMKRSVAALAAEIETTRAFFDSAEGIVIVSPEGADPPDQSRGARMFGYAHTELSDPTWSGPRVSTTSWQRSRRCLPALHTS
jgi:hypothetical protein